MRKIASARTAQGSSSAAAYQETPGAFAPTDAVQGGTAATAEAQGPTAATSVRGAKTVAGDFAAVASGRVGLIALSAASVLITTRLLGPRGYAVLALVGIVANLIWYASTSWTGTSARRYGREELELSGRMNRITWNRWLIGVPLVSGSVLLIVALKAAGVLPLGLTWKLVVIAIATSFGLMLVDHLTTMLEAGGRMRLSAGVQVVGKAMYVVALVAIFVSARHVSAPYVLLLNIGTYACVGLALAVCVWQMAIVPFEFDRALLRRMLKLSIPMIGFTVSQYVFSAVDVVILKIFRGQADVGVYAVAYQTFSTLTQAAQTLPIVLVPLFVSLRMAGRVDVVRRYMQRGVKQGAFVFAVTAGLAIPFIPVVVPVLFGSAFAGAAVPMSILICGLTFFFANSLLGPVLTLNEQSRAMAIVVTIGAILNVVGDVVMVAVLHMGIVAPAIATSGALVCMFVGYYVAAQRPLGIEMHVPLVELAPLTAGLVPTLVWGDITGTIIGLSAVVLVSAAVLIWNRPFRREDAAVIAKLRLPQPVKHAAIRIIYFLD